MITLQPCILESKQLYFLSNIEIKIINFITFYFKFTRSWELNFYQQTKIRFYAQINFVNIDMKKILKKKIEAH